MIKINDKIWFDQYKHGWWLHHKVEVKNKKTNRVTEIVRVSYPGNLEQLFTTVLDITHYEATDVQVLRSELRQAKGEVIKIARQIRTITSKNLKGPIEELTNYQKSLKGALDSDADQFDNGTVYGVGLSAKKLQSLAVCEKVE